MLRPALLCCACAICLQGLGQTATLTNASLTLLPGTHLRIAAPLTWVIGADAAVVNDGLIDLGTEAVLQEADGAPITGAGMEAATWAPASPLADAEPGGLGLTLTTAYAAGMLRVERGHLPRVAPSGAEGIARWYRVSTPLPTAEPIATVLRYDLAELNGASADDLALFTAMDPEGPWTPAISANDPLAQTVSGGSAAPPIHITAFDLDAAMPVAQPSQDDWAVWPTVAEEGIWVKPIHGELVHEIVVRDADGRVALRRAGGAAQGAVQLSLAGLAPGAYLVCVNHGVRTWRIMKR